MSRKLLLMDEPFGALDELTADGNAADLLLDIRAKTGATVMFGHLTASAKPSTSPMSSSSSASGPRSLPITFRCRCLIRGPRRSAIPRPLLSSSTEPGAPWVSRDDGTRHQERVLSAARGRPHSGGVADLCHAFAISRIVLPGPLDILDASIRNWSLLWRESWPTFLESVLGFALALLVGIPVAVCVAISRALNLTLYPILIATQSVPKVAIAPIILVWFGLGLQSKMVIAFLVAFFSRSSSIPRPACAQRLPVSIGACPLGLRASPIADISRQGAISRGAAVHLCRRQGRGHTRGDRSGHRRVRRLAQRSRKIFC